MTNKILTAEILHTLNIEHPHYVRVERQVFTQLSMGAPGSVVLLVGPTRVGKSRLISRVMDSLVVHPVPEGDKPVIIVEAATTLGGRFSMRHLTLRALEELAHPLTDTHAGVIRQSHSETQLRLRLEKTIHYRHTRYLVIDEAHHLLRTSRTLLASDFLDSLKCLANSTGVILILAGSYELFTTGLSSAHLNGRMRVIEFGRYRPEGEDERAFLGILKALDAHLPWGKGESLLLHAHFIFAGTLGCLGLLLQWVNAAMCEMAAKGERALGYEHFAETRFEEQIEVIAREIAVGELAMRKLAPSKLEMKSTKSSLPSRGSGPKRAPFQRAPKRDAVGRRGR